MNAILARSRWPAALLVSLSLAAGCSGSCAGKPGATAPGGGPLASPGPTSSSQPMHALSAGDLQPLINAQGNEGEIPERLVVEFAAPVTEETSFPAAAGAKTVLEITPPVPGTLAFTTASTLTFTPKKGLAPNTQYRIALKSVETAAGTVMAPAQGWTSELTTPSFSFQRLDLGGIDPEKRRLEVELVFTGPVDAKEVGRFASFRIGGTPVPAQLSPGKSRGSARALLSPREFVPVGTVALSLREGVHMKGWPKVEAASAQASVDFQSGSPLEILHAKRGEAPSGHYIEVACNDHSVGKTREVWDNDTDEEMHVSTKCVPRDDDAAERIHFSPAVKFSVVPSNLGFRILGDFKRGTYALRMDAGLRTDSGGMLLGTYDASFSFPARMPSVSFTSQGRYLPKQAWKSLPVSHINVSEAHLTVRQVPPEDLVFWMGDDESEKASDRDSNLILDKKIPLTGKLFHACLGR